MSQYPVVESKKKIYLHCFLAFLSCWTVEIDMFAFTCLQKIAYGIELIHIENVVWKFKKKKTKTQQQQQTNKQKENKNTRKRKEQRKINIFNRLAKQVSHNCLNFKQPFKQHSMHVHSVYMTPDL